MSLRINLLFSASPEQLFAAWNEKDLLELWLLNNVTNIICADIDPRPGGKFSIWENDTGKILSYSGEYIQVNRPHRLIFTFKEAARFEGESRLSVQFKTMEVGTEMYFMQVGVGAPCVEEALPKTHYIAVRQSGHQSWLTNAPRLT